MQHEMLEDVIALLI